VGKAQSILPLPFHCIRISRWNQDEINSTHHHNHLANTQSKISLVVARQEAFTAKIVMGTSWEFSQNLLLDHKRALRKGNYHEH
jgi:hypothetical protein